MKTKWSYSLKLSCAKSAIKALIIFKVKANFSFYGFIKVVQPTFIKPLFFASRIAVSVHNFPLSISLLRI